MIDTDANSPLAEGVATHGRALVVEFRLVLWLYAFAIFLGVLSALLHMNGSKLGAMIGMLATTTGFLAAAVSRLNHSLIISLKT